jgi:hypothetical protein
LTDLLLHKANINCYSLYPFAEQRPSFVICFIYLYALFIVSNFTVRMDLLYEIQENNWENFSNNIASREDLESLVGFTTGGSSLLHWYICHIEAEIVY